MTIRHFAALCLLLLACLAAPRAFAANDCNLVGTASGVNFGTYDPATGTAVTATGTITVACTGNRTVTFELGPGGGTILARRMTTASGTDQLSYNLYLEASNTTIFGQTGIAGSSGVCTTGVNSQGCMGDNPTGSDKLAQRTIYGLIPAGQNVGAGAYTDTITYTVVF
jgi:spore coat protein U-like protein